MEQAKLDIISALKAFDIEIEGITSTKGPTVTLYEITPKPGTRISKIKGLEDDLALSLYAMSARIIAPMPGRGTIGIEIPNAVRDIVSIGHVKKEIFDTFGYELPVVLGLTTEGGPFYFDLAKAPHVLMAGATGQGKSVGLNVMLHSLISAKTEEELKLVLIDPKRVEFHQYNKLENYLWLPVINDNSKAIQALSNLCKEMENRYIYLQGQGVRNIKEYNAIDNIEKFPYIVVMIDEFADLIMTAGKEVEDSITRLAQLARAVGIHLIIATQRPSVNVITGSIKANFPTRISFKVASKVDSRTILDQSGAEKLIGQGDMLISNGNEVNRVQCAYISTEEVENLCTEKGKKVENFVSLKEEKSQPILKLIAEFVVGFETVNLFKISKIFNISIAEAGKAIEDLEKLGVVSEFLGIKPRCIKVKDLKQLEEKFK